jgi:terminal uridylyltransferase
MAVNQASRGYNDALEFPKSGVGVQCDINFSAHLALQNTTLLRCYSHTDPRVRPLVLFIKHWAKRRGINTPYRGTLSSYGYVLMMIHYLVNVVQPFVCPNLQALGPQLPAPLDATGRLIPQFNPDGTPAHPPFDETVACRGRFVGFWRDEAAIQHLSATHQLNGNRDSIGHLLRGFFEYYAQNGYMTTYPTVNGFDWGREVISIRTPHGIVTKQRKGWTGAKTVIEVRGRASPDPGAPLPSPMDAIRSPTDANPTPAGKASVSTGGGGEIKEIRNRYLFAIEDPFELDHNVARTVTHKGIVSIRDEFRRAWRIIRATTADGPALSKHGIPEELLEDADVQTEKTEENTHEFAELLAEIHGLAESQ